jgi:hypothetical protein
VEPVQSLAALLATTEGEWRLAETNTGNDRQTN